MGNSSFTKLRKLQAEAQSLLDEKNVANQDDKGVSRSRRFALFWVLVGRSFVRNRCPTRAAALAYTTLLAIVPLLAVVISVSTSLLKKDEGELQIREWVDAAVDKIAPQLGLISNTGQTTGTNTTAAPLSAEEIEAMEDFGFFFDDWGDPKEDARTKIVNQIMKFVRNFQSGALGVTAVLALVFVAISLLSTIEATLNDMWGVTQGRRWVSRVVQYWAALTLGPMLLFVAFGLTTGQQFGFVKSIIDRVPFLGTLIFSILPFVVLSVFCSLFYALMPNTKVSWKAAFAGGTVAGCLLQLNSLFNVLYVSRVVTYKQIYGSLAIFPLFLLGLYFSWLILLFGAQTAYAVQNRKAYLQERQMEKVNQRAKEFVAFRLMTLIGIHFSENKPPPTATEMAEALGVPLKLICEVLRLLLTERLVVESAGKEFGYLPARPLTQITADNILMAMRVGHGDDVATCPDEAREIVRAGFDSIAEAEKNVASGLTLQTLAERGRKGAKTAA